MNDLVIFTMEPSGYTTKRKYSLDFLMQFKDIDPNNLRLLDDILCHQQIDKRSKSTKIAKEPIAEVMVVIEKEPISAVEREYWLVDHQIRYDLKHNKIFSRRLVNPNLTFREISEVIAKLAKDGFIDVIIKNAEYSIKLK